MLLDERALPHCTLLLLAGGYGGLVLFTTVSFFRIPSRRLIYVNSPIFHLICLLHLIVCAFNATLLSLISGGSLLFLYVSSFKIPVLFSLFWLLALLQGALTHPLALAAPVLGLFQCVSELKLLKNFYSSLTFSWLNPLICQGYKHNYISLKDVDAVPVDLHAEKASDKLRDNWNDRPLGEALWRTFGPGMLLAMLVQLAENVICFAQPQLLRLLLKYIAGYHQGTDLTPGLVICLLMFAVLFVTTNLNNQFSMKMYKIGLQMKGLLVQLVYNKALRISPEARLGHATGDIVNLVLVDVTKVQNLSQQAPLFFLIPTKIVLAILLLHNLLGNAIFAGLLVVVIMIPLNTFILRLLKSLKKTQMKFKDLRIKMVLEALAAIRSVKLHNWEFSMLDTITRIRNDKELKNMRCIGAVMAINRLFWCVIPVMISLATFYLYPNALTLDIVFPALSLFSILTAPVINIPLLFSCVIEALVALERLLKFLSAEEIQQLLVCPGYEDDPKIEVRNATFCRGLKLLESEKDEEAAAERTSRLSICLNEINFSASNGEFVCVVGPVGSGKLTLLSAIIGELPIVPLIDSHFHVAGLVAYCSQIPWIMNTSIRENILFGRKFDPDFYQKVVETCDLVNDFPALAHGDETLVGEKGIALSGGQKARLALARAIYADRQVYILDDVLSAVDSHVASKIVLQVLSSETGLLKDKVRVLVTNNAGALLCADRIVTLKSGSICADDDASDLTLTPVSTSSVALSSSGSLDSCANTLAPLPKKSHEHSKNGSVKWSTYWKYAKLCLATGIVLFFFAVAAGSVFLFLSKYWLKSVSEHNDGVEVHLADSLVHTKRFVGVYFLLGLGLSMFVFLRTVVLYQLCLIRASKKLHAQMASLVLFLPMSFFDTTPLGRILNRFLADINKIDDNLPKTFARFFSLTATAALTLGVIVVNLPVSVVPMCVLMVVYYYYQAYYIAALRDMKRIGLASRSPVFNHLQETLCGTDTIRSFGAVGEFALSSIERVGFNLKALYVLRAVNRWLTFRLQLIGALVILLASGLSLFSLTTSHPLTNGVVGLVMAYALDITESLNSIVKASVDIETNVVCVERVLEYSKLPSEGPYRNPIDDHIPENWTDSPILFSHYSARYRPGLNLVLKDLCLEIGAGEKIGVVGRTGAGKSSLAMAFFRLIEASEGGISIGSVETASVGLSRLRNSLNIIPQDCLAVQGTIRLNLDPVGVHLDEELLRALRCSHLLDYLVVQDNGRFYDDANMRLLDMPLYEGGRNLSVGQRQLLCLARALLNPLKILILDEATAAVDPETDRVVQETIRNEFADRTILTIAHRLDTVLDCDRILVLDYGQVAEFDTPSALLANENGLFYRLCDEGGCLRRNIL